MLVKLWTKKSKLPFYSELTAKSNGAYDSRSGQEIVDSLVSKWRRKRAAQRGDNG